MLFRISTFEFRIWLRSDFDNLALKNFERFLDQGIVFEIFFVEGNGREFLLLSRILRHGGPSGRHRWRGFWWECRARCGWFRALCRNFGCTLLSPNRRISLDELNLAIRMPKFGELGLEKRLVFRVVDKTDVILNLRSEANYQHVVFERNGM